MLGLALAAGTSVGGAAYAWWATDGRGVASAPTQALTGVTLSPATPTAELYPGGTSTVVLTIANPDNADAHIGSLTLDEGLGAGGFAVDADHSTCDLSTLSFTTATNGLSGWDVAGTGSTAATLPAALSMGLDATDGCQGAHVTVHLVAGP